MNNQPPRIRITEASIRVMLPDDYGGEFEITAHIEAVGAAQLTPAVLREAMHELEREIEGIVGERGRVHGGESSD